MTNFQRIIVGALIILVVVNLVLIVIIWGGRPSRRIKMKAPKAHERIERFFDRSIDLDANQRNDFRRLQRAHRESMAGHNQQIRILNKAFHRAIVHGDKEIEQQISLQMDSVHALIKLATTEHIRSLANICSPDQKEQLLKALDEVPNRQGHRGNPRRRKHD